MIRHTLFALAVLGIAGAAVAAAQPQTGSTGGNPENVTVLYKNLAFPVYGPVVMEKCAKEDCSDVQS